MMNPCGVCRHRYNPEDSIIFGLYTQTIRDKIECSNELVEGSGKTIFKAWENRLTNVFVESDVDEELLFNIPFAVPVKLKIIKVIGEDSNTHPSKMRVYKNRPAMTFEDCSAPPDQEFEVVKDTSGFAEYPTKADIFYDVTHLTLHFPTNYDAPKTKIIYIGMKGEFNDAHRPGGTVCPYEPVQIPDEYRSFSDLCPYF